VWPQGLQIRAFGNSLCVTVFDFSLATDPLVCSGDSTAIMFDHRAVIRWKRAGPDFLKGKYSREHTWSFDGGVTVPASPSPAVVPAPWSNPAHVDPEEAFVASIASCRLLTFLFLASRQGFQIDSYEDEAVGVMAQNERGVPWISTVTLHPKIVYGGDKVPAPADEARLHHEAHEQCFIANSVKTQISVASA
jgi:organic hydroperoxide reductase OsmC/OhrA